jgi:hypothetical protein
MNCSPTLTSDEFSTIHNAKCSLHSVAQRLEGVINDALHKQLIDAIAELDRGLERAYELDDQVVDRNCEHYDGIADEIGIRTSSWSMHEVPDLNANHPFGDKELLAYSKHFGLGEVKVFIEGPTWKDLWFAAEAAIRLSGDLHHIFVEGFEQSKSKENTLVLSTGS